MPYRVHRLTECEPCHTEILDDIDPVRLQAEGFSERSQGFVRPLGLKTYPTKEVESCHVRRFRLKDWSTQGFGLGKVTGIVEAPRPADRFIDGEHEETRPMRGWRECNLRSLW